MESASVSSLKRIRKLRRRHQMSAAYQDKVYNETTQYAKNWPAGPERALTETNIGWIPTWIPRHGIYRRSSKYIHHVREEVATAIAQDFVRPLCVRRLHGRRQQFSNRGRVHG